jgi:hypothetical protein
MVEDAVVPCPPYIAKAPAQLTAGSVSPQTLVRPSLVESTMVAWYAELAPVADALLMSRYSSLVSERSIDRIGAV